MGDVKKVRKRSLSRGRCMGYGKAKYGRSFTKPPLGDYHEKGTYKNPVHCYTAQDLKSRVTVQPSLPPVKIPGDIKTLKNAGFVMADDDEVLNTGFYVNYPHIRSKAPFEVKANPTPQKADKKDDIDRLSLSSFNSPFGEVRLTRKTLPSSSLRQWQRQIELQLRNILISFHVPEVLKKYYCRIPERKVRRKSRPIEILSRKRDERQEEAILAWVKAHSQDAAKGKPGKFKSKKSSHKESHKRRSIRRESINQDLTEAGVVSYNLDTDSSSSSSDY